MSALDDKLSVRTGAKDRRIAKMHGKEEAMDDITVVLERHDQSIRSMQTQIDDLKEVHKEIRKMSETLIMLTTELKHTNGHLESQERRLELIESAPKNRLNQIVTAIVAALAGALITAAVNFIVL